MQNALTIFNPSESEPRSLTEPQAEPSRPHTRGEDALSAREEEGWAATPLNA